MAYLENGRDRRSKSGGWRIEVLKDALDVQQHQLIPSIAHR